MTFPLSTKQSGCWEIYRAIVCQYLAENRDAKELVQWALANRNIDFLENNPDVSRISSRTTQWNTNMQGRSYVNFQMTGGR